MDDSQSPAEHTPEEEERLRRIEEQLERIGASEDRVELPEPPSEAEIEQRMAEQKQRLRVSKQQYEKLASKGTFNPEDSKGMGIGLSAAYGIIGLPLVGAGAGWLLDRWLHTSWCTFAGVVLGVVGGMVYAVSLTNRR